MVSSTSTSSRASSEQESLIGRTPDYEIDVSPRWVVFTPDDGYKNAQIGKLVLTNRDKEIITFRIRARERTLFLFTRGYGFLQPGESSELVFFLMPSDVWQRDPIDYAGRRVRVMVETLLLPPSMSLIPPKLQQTHISRKMFRTTARLAPATRIYTKFNVFIPKLTEDFEAASKRSG